MVGLFGYLILSGAVYVVLLDYHQWRKIELQGHKNDPVVEHEVDPNAEHEGDLETVVEDKANNARVQISPESSYATAVTCTSRSLFWLLVVRAIGAWRRRRSKCPHVMGG